MISGIYFNNNEQEESDDDESSEEDDEHLNEIITSRLEECDVNEYIKSSKYIHIKQYINIFVNYSLLEIIVQYNYNTENYYIKE